MILATGDCHGGFQRFSRKHFPQQRQMGRDDYMIILGDFGGVWDGSSEERKQLDWLNEKPFTTLFVTGNHENYWMLRELPVEDWHGGKVQRVRPNILHLMRGQLYDIEGHTFFSMGGATSHDVEDGILDPNAPDFRVQYSRLIFGGRRRFRIIGKSWWPEELPSDEEYTAALDTLERAGWKADYVITHCAPTSIAQQMNRHYQPDALTDFLELVNNRLEFGCWLFGHYHDNREIDPKHILLWEQIVQLV